MEERRSQVLALHQTRQGAERLRELVGAAPAAQLVGLEGSVPEFEAKAARLQPQVLLVELAGGVNGLAETLERLQRLVPAGAIVTLARSRDPDDILTAMRLGVREYLVEPVTPQAFNEAVLRLVRLHAAAGGPAGQVVAVMGVKGGVGTSLVALNLAWCFSQDPSRSVALVDLDLFAGDLALLADRPVRRDLSEAAAHYQRLDAVFVAGLTCEVAPGLRLLPAPEDPAAAEEVRGEHVARVLELLADTHGLVVADLPSRPDEAVLAALDRAEVLVVVLEPSLVGLAGARRLLGLLDRLEFPGQKRLVVVNRFGLKGALGKGELVRALGVEPAAWLPEDSRTILEAVASGRPVCRDWPRSRWSRRLAALAEDIAARLPAARKEARA